METWGELFWDAWIRLRLACRRFYRTYWPPHFKAWQVCTVTGVISIILTLVVLNLPSSKTDLQAKTDDAAGSDSEKPTKAASKAGLAAVSSDPFAETDSTESASVAVDEGTVPPPQGETLESEFAEPITNKPGRTEVAAADFPPAEATDQGLPLIDASGDQPVLEAPPEGAIEAPLSAAEMPEKAAASIATDEPTLTTPETEAELPAENPQATVGSDSGTDEQPPALELPARDPGHYGRFGDDKDESQEPTSKIRATRIKDLPPAKQHTPFETPIRPKGHYTRLGNHEDSEEDRHSVRNIRPTRTDSVPIPGGKVLVQAPKEEPADPALTDSQAPPESPELPPVPTEPGAAEVATEEPMAAEPPPVLFAPETKADPAQPDVPAPGKPAEYHGPVKSTEPADHQAHQEEDAFSLPSRKTAPTAKPRLPVVDEAPLEPQEHKPLKGKSTKATDHEAHQAEDQFSLPPRKTAPPPVAVPSVTREVPVEAAEPNDHKPVLKSSEPADHEAHQEEDVFSRPTHKTAPQAKVVPPAVEVPMESETQKPVTNDALENTTAPRTPRRTPHIVQEHEESPTAPEKVNPHLDEDRVLPMAVTRPRNTERVTIPERIPAEALPMEPVLPTGREDSEFTAATPRPKPAAGPQLVMEITGPRQVPVGTQVVLHFKLQNVGTAPATGIVVTDVLPVGLQHRLSPDLEYTVARLNPGETRETNLTVQCVSRGTITNKAVLRADGDVAAQAEIELEVTDATAGSATQPRNTQSPLTINHHGPERWLIDSTGQFLVTVTNNGGQTLKNVTISQTYPQGTNLVHATVGHKTDEKNRTVSWTISEFTPGVSYILETELHSLTSGPATSIARIKVGNTEVAEDRWTAVSFSAAATVPGPPR